MFRCRSECARCISLALLLLLNLLFVTTGSAIPLRKGYLVNERIGGPSPLTEGEFRVSRPYALPDFRMNLKDSDSRGTLHADTGGNLVLTSLDAMGRSQFGSETNFRTEETDHGRKTGEKYFSRNRRFLRGPRGPGRPRPQGWFMTQHHDQGRRVTEESNTTTATGQHTQPFYLGPPAPPGIVHNEKQDWNQDYAEPDVHPPSSN